MVYGLSVFEQFAIWSVLGVAILGLLYALFLRRQILREDKGTPKMLEVWGAIREGADLLKEEALLDIFSKATGCPVVSLKNTKPDRAIFRGYICV